MTDHPDIRPPSTPRVLIVEDEARLRELLTDVTPDMGFEPSAVSSAEQAIAHLDAHADAPPHVVLLDLNLPGMGGLDFLAKLRERRGHAATPVIIMTGFGDLPAAQEAIRLGVTDFLTKPCHLGEIEAALGRARHTLIAIKGSGVVSDSVAAPAPTPPDDTVTIAELEKRAILAALRRTGGNRSAAASELGISRRTLYNKLAEYEGHDDWPDDL